MSTQRATHKPRDLTHADRLQIVLESFEHGARIAAVARRNRVNPSSLARWRRSYKAGRLASAHPAPLMVPISELAMAAQRIRDLERELGRMALENAKLLEAVQFVQPRPVRGQRGVRVKKRKK